MESLGLSHNKKCRCGHNHWQHNFSGGCKVILGRTTRIDKNSAGEEIEVEYDKYCDCDCYDQSERTIRVPATKIPTIEAVGPKPKKGAMVFFDDAVTVSTEKQEAHDIFIATQARVNELKQKARALSSTAEQSSD